MSEGKLYVLLAVAGLVPLLLVLFLGRDARAAENPASARAGTTFRGCMPACAPVGEDARHFCEAAPVSAPVVWTWF